MPTTVKRRQLSNRTVVLLALFSILALSCSDQVDASSPLPKPRIVKVSGGYIGDGFGADGWAVMKDQETGCEYLYVDGTESVAITKMGCPIKDGVSTKPECIDEQDPTRR